MIEISMINFKKQEEFHLALRKIYRENENRLKEIGEDDFVLLFTEVYIDHRASFNFESDDLSDIPLDILDLVKKDFYTIL